jgi:hypothetical protein
MIIKILVAIQPRLRGIAKIGGMKGPVAPK